MRGKLSRGAVGRGGVTVCKVVAHTSDKAVIKQLLCMLTKK